MQQIAIKGHVLTLLPHDPNQPGTGVDIYCSNIFLLYADPSLHPVFSLKLWLNRAVELINMMQLGMSC